MAHVKNHDYHILPPSLKPLLSSIAAFIMLYGAVMWMAKGTPFIFLIGLAGVLFMMWTWWAEAIKESNMGDHTPVVRIGLRYGVIMFIMSEVMFFVAWFWAFFKTTMYPMHEYAGTEYQEPSIHAIDAFHLPLMNTLLLLISGCFVTWAHHALVHGNIRKDIVAGLAGGVLFGVVFTLFQAYEYYELLVHEGYTFGGDVFFGTFFMATGFHGFHVLIGTIFLLICLFRARAGAFTPEQHVGFEAAAWYWHFVDVVWLFLFVAVYIWGQ